MFTKGHKINVGRKRSIEFRQRISELNRQRGKLSEETKRKIRESCKRNAKSWNRGLTKENNESLQRISEKRKGMKFPKEWRENMSKSFKGREYSPEGRKKLKLKWKNHPHPMFGKKHSEETKRKMSAKRKGINWNGRKGETHIWWKGGISPLTHQIRESFKYRQWRSDIFTRDDYSCVKCGKRGNVRADHYPKSFSTIFQENKIKSLEEAINCEEFWNINNGRTLCEECHKLTDNYGWKTYRKKCECR